VGQPPVLRANGYAVARDLRARLIDVDGLRPLGRDTRRHSPAQTRKLKASIEQFGFVLPIVIDEADRVVGAGVRWFAALWPLRKFPAVTL
jgi:ParB-like chromosome segregation protein Spo0J